MGKFFEWALGGNPVWGWLGVCYTNAGAELCVEFEDRDGWGLPVCEVVRQQQPSRVKEGVLRFYYRGQAPFDKEAMSEFLHEVLSGIARGESVTEVPAENRTHEKRLLAMKAFPMLLDSLFRELEERFRAKDSLFGAYDFVPADSRGQVKPSEFCGRYFELRPRESDDALKCEAEKLRGWMGALYSDGCKYANDERPGANEPIVREGAPPVFMIELWGRCLTCAETDGWRKNSWGAVCRIFKGIPTADEVWKQWCQERD